MFERAITQTIQRISSEILRDRQSIPLSEILEDERIPSRFKPFFATEVRWWLRNESIARSANRRFDVADPELASLIDYLDQVMFRHARFDREDFTATLDTAVKLTYNFVCRPQTTLRWYIFRGQPVKPLDEVMLRFGAFVDYEYFGDVFSGWVERKVHERATFEAISAIEFERIIRRVDDQILLSCTVDELLALLDPMFEVVGAEAGGRVPLDALIVFFDDKNIARLVDHLESYRTGPDMAVTREDFVRMLDELLTTAEDNPEADFSTVYQQDDLDEIVRLHLETTGRASAGQAAIEPEADSLEAASAPTGRTPVDAPSVSEIATPSAPATAPDPQTEPAGRVEPARATEPAELPHESRNAAAPRPEPTEPRQAPADAHREGPVPTFDAPAPSPRLAPLLHDESLDDDDSTAAVTHEPRTGGAGIASRIDPMLERKIIKKVFGKDADAYRQGLRRLEAAETWRDASRILDEIFAHYEVDPYSRTALRLADAVYARFESTTHS